MANSIGQEIIDAIDEVKDKYDREKVMTAMAEAIAGYGGNLIINKTDPLAKIEWNTDSESIDFVIDEAQ